MLNSNDSTSIYTGNARFKGFCIDLLDNIAKMLKFDYVITHQAGRGRPWGAEVRLRHQVGGRRQVRRAGRTGR